MQRYRSNSNPARYHIRRGFIDSSESASSPNVFSENYGLRSWYHRQRNGKGQWNETAICYISNFVADDFYAGFDLSSVCLVSIRVRRPLRNRCVVPTSMLLGKLHYSSDFSPIDKGTQKVFPEYLLFIRPV